MPQEVPRVFADAVLQLVRGKGQAYSFSGMAEEWWLVISHCFPSHL
jgi:hypothetical protein